MHAYKDFSCIHMFKLQDKLWILNTSTSRSEQVNKYEKHREKLRKTKQLIEKEMPQERKKLRKKKNKKTFKNTTAEITQQHKRTYRCVKEMHNLRWVHTCNNCINIKTKLHTMLYCNSPYYLLYTYFTRPIFFIFLFFWFEFLYFFYWILMLHFFLAAYILNKKKTTTKKSLLKCSVKLVSQ